MSTDDRLTELVKSSLNDVLAQSEISYITPIIVEKLISNGVIAPPCKVGDKVYFVFEGDVLSDEITLIEVTESTMYLSTCSERYMLIDGYLYSEMLDEKAYFTKKEAESALKGSAE